MLCYVKMTFCSLSHKHQCFSSSIFNVISTCSSSFWRRRHGNMLWLCHLDTWCSTACDNTVTVNENKTRYHIYVVTALCYFICLFLLLISYTVRLIVFTEMWPISVLVGLCVLDYNCQGIGNIVQLWVGMLRRPSQHPNPQLYNIPNSLTTAWVHFFLLLFVKLLTLVVILRCCILKIIRDTFALLFTRFIHHQSADMCDLLHCDVIGQYNVYLLLNDSPVCEVEQSIRFSDRRIVITL